MTKSRGADFSSAQDLAAVRRALAQGIDFAFVKLTQGTGYVNPRATDQTVELGRRIVGYYHFLTADADGAAQWDHFERSLASVNPYWHGGPIAVDHESDRGVMPPDYIAAAFIRRARQRGFKVGRYASGAVFQRTRSLGEAWRWVAWWGPTPPLFAWDVWQFSDGGGEQDWNLFNGDAEQLAAWARKVGHYKWPPHPPRRWWLHDDFTHRARGPYRLPALGAALVTYLARHPKTARLRLERK